MDAGVAVHSWHWLSSTCFGASRREQPDRSVAVGDAADRHDRGRSKAAAPARQWWPTKTHALRPDSLAVDAGNGIQRRHDRPARHGFPTRDWILDRHRCFRGRGSGFDLRQRIRMRRPCSRRVDAACQQCRGPVDRQGWILTAGSTARDLFSESLADGAQKRRYPELPPDDFGRSAISMLLPNRLPLPRHCHQ